MARRVAAQRNGLNGVWLLTVDGNSASATVWWSSDRSPYRCAGLGVSGDAPPAGRPDWLA